MQRHVSVSVVSRESAACWREQRRKHALASLAAEQNQNSFSSSTSCSESESDRSDGVRGFVWSFKAVCEQKCEDQEDEWAHLDRSNQNCSNYYKNYHMQNMTRLKSVCHCSLIENYVDQWCVCRERENEDMGEGANTCQSQQRRWCLLWLLIEFVYLWAVLCVLWLSEQKSFVSRGCDSTIIPHLWYSHSFLFGSSAGLRYCFLFFQHWALNEVLVLLVYLTASFVQLKKS